jgi:hypothetical protein
VNASVVAAYLATKARVPPGTPLYLIGGNVSDTDVKAFRAQGYNNVHRGIPGAAVFGPSDLLLVSYYDATHHYHLSSVTTQGA